MGSEWVVVDGMGEEHVDVIEESEDPLLAELLGMLEDPAADEAAEGVRAYTSWAELVKDGAPFPRPSRAVREPELAERRSPRSRSPSPEPDTDEKAWAADKYERKAKRGSFGHTMRAKRAMVGVKATHVIVPKASGVTTELDALLPALDAPGPATGCLVPLTGPLQYATAEEIAAELGASVVVAKHAAVPHARRTARLEAVLAGYRVTELDVPGEAGRKRYVVCEPPRASGHVKHPKCGAAAGRAAFAKGGALLQELRKERAWREEIRFGMDTCAVEA